MMRSNTMMIRVIKVVTDMVYRYFRRLCALTGFLTTFMALQLCGNRREGVRASNSKALGPRFWFQCGRGKLMDVKRVERTTTSLDAAK